MSSCFRWDSGLVGKNPFDKAAKIVESSGFEAVDETANHKLGLAGTKPGNHVVFEVDAGDVGDDKWKEGQLTLMYLTSFEHMGRARVECVGGCGCDTTEIDGHIKAQQSVMASVMIPLQLHDDELGRAHKCQVRVSVLDETESEGHKVKLLQVVFDVFLD